MIHRFFGLTTSLWLATSPIAGLAAAEPETPVQAPEAAEISWQQNFDQALAMAKKEHRPLFLYFTGSDWCIWCKKMDREILESPTFQQALAKKLIFVKVDFPSTTELPPSIREQNEQLKNRFHIEGFPTVILLDPNQNIIATLGYDPGGAKAFASAVEEILRTYKAPVEGASSKS